MKYILLLLLALIGCSTSIEDQDEFIYLSGEYLPQVLGNKSIGIGVASDYSMEFKAGHSKEFLFVGDSVEYKLEVSISDSLDSIFYDIGEYRAAYTLAQDTNTKEWSPYFSYNNFPDVGFEIKDDIQIKRNEEDNFASMILRTRYCPAKHLEYKINKSSFGYSAVAKDDCRRLELMNQDHKFSIDFFQAFNHYNHGMISYAVDEFNCNTIEEFRGSSFYGNESTNEVVIGHDLASDPNGEKIGFENYKVDVIDCFVENGIEEGLAELIVHHNMFDDLKKMLSSKVLE